MARRQSLPVQALFRLLPLCRLLLYRKYPAGGSLGASRNLPHPYNAAGFPGAHRLLISLLHVVPSRNLEPRILRMSLHLSFICRASMKLKPGLARVTSRRTGSHRKLVMSVGQGEPIAEAAIGPKPDRPSADGHPRIGFGRAVDHQFGIDIEPETFPLLLLAAQGTGNPRLLATGGAGNVVACPHRPQAQFPLRALANE